MPPAATPTAANRFRFLAEAAAWRYREQGFAVRRRVLANLLRDPLYRSLFHAGRLPVEGPVLALGCGRGMFLALLASAQTLGLGGGEKRGAPLRLVGIEPDPAAATSARTALADRAEIITAELHTTALPRCRAAILVDALQTLEPGQQDGLLERLAAALEPGGRIILRETDAGQLWQRAKFRLAGRLRGKNGKPRHLRRAEAWQNKLETLGLRLETLPDSGAAGFGNVLFLAQKTH